MITSAFDELLAEGITEEIVCVGFVVSVFEVFLQDVYHCVVQWNYKWFSVLCDIYVDYVVIEVQIFYLDVYQTSLPDSCGEKEVGYNPALVFCKGAFLEIRLF